MSAIRLPPGPKGHFLTGSLPEYRRDTLGLFETLARHGDLASFRLGWRQFYFLNHPDLVEQVLVTDYRNFHRSFVARMSRTLLGEGMLLSDGDYWLRQRRLAQPAFHRQRVASYGEVITAAAGRLADSWHGGEIRDVHPEMMRLTLEVAAKTLFDADVTGDAEDVGRSIDAWMVGFDRWINSPLPLPFWVPTPANLRLWRAMRRLDEVVYRIINQRRASGEDRGDLLSMLLQARDEDGSRMTDKQLRDEVLTVLLAGHETTALALSWAWYLLATHPEAEARVAAEWQAVLGGRTPTFADLPQLKYTEMVVSEALRLYPPFYLFGREVVRDCELGGYRVPAGATVLMCQWVMHRDPRFFDAPDQFRPERWADGLAKRLPKFAYFPFGGGPRVCIGKEFALMEAVLVLAAIGQRFRTTLVPGHVVAPKPSATLRPAAGVKMVLARRDRTAPGSRGTGPGAPASVQAV